jgi:hypothetical protein
MLIGEPILNFTNLKTKGMGQLCAPKKKKKKKKNS